MRKVLVSVICTNYNKGDWIGDAIESFLRQKTSFEFEILLIDDKSTDESTKIIRQYAKNHPDKIRAFYNQKNLGITKTWIKICKEAKGKYIARCDGDDFWTDEHKLQKQVDLLEQSTDSRWCCTDYDVVSPDGAVTHRSAVETGLFVRPDSYPEMLAKKGMTMASTWVAETKLLQDINADLDDSAVDDTFNIQLDLFSMTKLSYIPDSTVAYRVNEGSDSKPVDVEAIKSRNRRLLETQIQYIDKYKDVGYREIIESLLHQVVESDDRLLYINWLEKRIRTLDDVIRDKDKEIAHRDAAIRSKDKEIVELLNSKRYKIGKAVVSPVSIAKSILNQEKKI